MLFHITVVSPTSCALQYTHQAQSLRTALEYDVRHTGGGGGGGGGAWRNPRTQAQTSVYSLHASKISNSTEESVRLEALTDMHIRVWVKWERREGMCQSNQWLFKRLSFSILINIGKGPESMPPPPPTPCFTNWKHLPKCVSGP